MNTLPGTVTTEGGGRRRRRRRPRPGAAGPDRPRWRTGQPVVVGVRPEHLALAPDGPVEHEGAGRRVAGPRVPGLRHDRRGRRRRPPDRHGRPSTPAARSGSRSTRRRPPLRPRHDGPPDVSDGRRGWRAARYTPREIGAGAAAAGARRSSSFVAFFYRPFLNLVALGHVREPAQRRLLRGRRPGASTASSSRATTSARACGTACSSCSTRCRPAWCSACCWPWPPTAGCKGIKVVPGRSSARRWPARWP